MEETGNNKHIKDSDYEIDIRELFYALWQGKLIIISVSAFVSIIGVIYSLSLPNIYESKALLVPTNQTSGISGAFQGYSGLAGLAGISLPSSGNGSNSVKAMQKIKSLSFFENNIMQNISLPDLMAVKSWNPETNTLTYDQKIYTKSTNSWIDKKPTAQSSFGQFQSQLNLSEDKKSGFITLSMNHQSPFVAKQWVELIVNEINSYYREKDKAESEKAVNYLNEQFSMAGLTEIKQVLAQILQEETKKLTLIEANDFYVFDYIDPPAVMEKKSEPSRAIICIISALLGGMLSIIIVIVKYYFFNKKVS